MKGAMKGQTEPTRRVAPLAAAMEAMTLDAFAHFEISEKKRGYKISRYSLGVLLVTAAVFAGLLLMPLPHGLTAPGRGAIAVFAVALILWTTNVIPLAVTGLLAM